MLSNFQPHLLLPQTAKEQTAARRPLLPCLPLLPLFPFHASSLLPFEGIKERKTISHSFSAFFGTRGEKATTEQTAARRPLLPSLPFLPLLPFPASSLLPLEGIKERKTLIHYFSGFFGTRGETATILSLSIVSMSTTIVECQIYSILHQSLSCSTTGLLYLENQPKTTIFPGSQLLQSKERLFFFIAGVKLAESLVPV